MSRSARAILPFHVAGRLEQHPPAITEAPQIAVIRIGVTSDHISTVGCLLDAPSLIVVAFAKAFLSAWRQKADKKKQIKCGAKRISFPKFHQHYIDTSHTRISIGTTYNFL
jgi:hypothetical protein